MKPRLSSWLIVLVIALAGFTGMLIDHDSAAMVSFEVA
jgi:hypothetical protein